MNIFRTAALILCFVGIVQGSFGLIILSLICFEISSHGRGVIAWFLTRK